MNSNDSPVGIAQKPSDIWGQEAGITNCLRMIFSSDARRPWPLTIFAAFGLLGALAVTTQSEEQFPLTDINDRGVARSVILARLMNQECAKFFKVNREKWTAMETIYLNVGVFIKEFNEMLEEEERSVQKQVRQLGMADWCERNRTLHHSLNPMFFE